MYNSKENKFFFSTTIDMKEYILQLCSLRMDLTRTILLLIAITNQYKSNSNQSRIV